MILVDRPYISDFLRKTIKEHSLPVADTPAAAEMGFTPGHPEAALQQLRSCENPLIYTVSENSIAWIAENLSGTPLPDWIDIFKNKARFREMIKPMYPDFFFREVLFRDLEDLDPGDVPLPFIVKPGVGFFSMGVRKVTHRNEWKSTVDSIKSEIENTGNVYPAEVLNTASFIIEEYADGDEFAVDAFFDSEGEPVILGIFNHIFSSGEDVSDRVYITSKNIVQNNLDEFTGFLRHIGLLSGVRNFPVHAEIRRDSSGRITPIEINPMRFGGWCTTADISAIAWGFNPYVYYFSQKRPDWPEILKQSGEKLYSIIVLDNSTGIEESRISSFNYDLLLSRFENPLELRKTDYKQYAVFGFLFAETSEENFSELEWVLGSDLREFITTAP